jgi:hypothetical protein
VPGTQQALNKSKLPFIRLWHLVFPDLFTAVSLPQGSSLCSFPFGARRRRRRRRSSFLGGNSWPTPVSLGRPGLSLPCPPPHPCRLFSLRGALPPFRARAESARVNLAAPLARQARGLCPDSVAGSWPGPRPCLCPHSHQDPPAPLPLSVQVPKPLAVLVSNYLDVTPRLHPRQTLGCRERQGCQEATGQTLSQRLGLGPVAQGLFERAVVLAPQEGSPQRLSGAHTARGGKGRQVTLGGDQRFRGLSPSTTILTAANSNGWPFTEHLLGTSPWSRAPGQEMSKAFQTVM